MVMILFIVIVVVVITTQPSAYQPPGYACLPKQHEVALVCSRPSARCGGRYLSCLSRNV